MVPGLEEEVRQILEKMGRETLQSGGINNPLADLNAKLGTARMEIRELRKDIAELKETVKRIEANI